jgi:hypothetical protein
LALLEADVADIVGVQESCKVSLAKIAAQVPGWVAYQDTGHRGKANTGILYRRSVPVIRCRYVPYIDSPTDHLAARFIAEAQLAGGVVFASGHRQPARDRSDWKTSDKVLHDWARGRQVVLAIDSNAHTAAIPTMEQRTGLRFVHVGIDGFLTSLPAAQVSKPVELAEPHSDHHPVVVTITL